MEKEKKNYISYMQASMLLFTASLLLTVYLFLTAVHTHGGLNYFQGILGFVGLLFSLIGAVIPIYGHYSVKIDGKIDWRVGFALNLLLCLFLLFLYGMGLQVLI